MKDFVIDGRSITFVMVMVMMMLTVVLCIGESARIPPYSCDAEDPATKSFGFCDAELPIEERVQDLISRMTLEEKVSQLVHNSSAIPRLGVPYFQWWSEALHGVGGTDELETGITFHGDVKAATSFPQVILTASTFDANLWYRIGKAIGTEARALYNEGQSTGMTFWSPNINIFRDPRWGRGQETPGEDPLLNSIYGVSFVRGIQGDSFLGGDLKDDQLLVSACCKHLTAYDLENWNGFTRDTFNANVTKQDMADTYQPPFKSCVEEARVSGVMCAYNRVNGVPNCADYDLLTGTVRKQWGFQGYIASDCGVVEYMYERQHYAKSPENAVALALKAGIDLECGAYLKIHAKSAIENGKMSEADIDRALSNIFSIRMRLGLFNGDPRELPFGKLDRKDVCNAENQDLALEAARHGIVLLKNSEHLLPLSKTRTMSLAVIGPNANASKTLIGNYAGPPCKTITPLEGLLSYVSKIEFHPGCESINCTSPSLSNTLKIAESADYIVLVMGLDTDHEGEELDRMDLTLPGEQENLVKNISKAAKRPVILVLLCGGPVDVSFAENDPKIGSILWAGYPGEAGGKAIAEIIFGDHNPGGRLPITWYPKDFIEVPMTDMRMRADTSSGYPGRTYRFYQGQPVYEFGHGLSYSNYTYKFVSVTQNKIDILKLPISNMLENSSYMSVSDMGSESCAMAEFSVVVSVKNVGRIAGKNSVLLYLRRNQPANGSPLKQLIGFQWLRLNASEESRLEFEVSPCNQFAEANEDGLFVIGSEARVLVVGDQEYSLSPFITTNRPT